MITKNNRQASCVILLILIAFAPPTLKGMTDKMPLKAELWLPRGTAPVRGFHVFKNTLSCLKTG